MECMASKTRSQNSATVPAWLPSVKQRMQDLLALPENWDSYGAVRPNAKVVTAAAQWLESVCGSVDLLPPMINPTRTGGVLLLWEAGPHELEVDFESPRSATFVYTDEESGDTASRNMIEDHGGDTDCVRILGEHFSS